MRSKKRTIVMIYLSCKGLFLRTERSEVQETDHYLTTNTRDIYRQWVDVVVGGGEEEGGGGEGEGREGEEREE